MVSRQLLRKRRKRCIRGEKEVAVGKGRKRLYLWDGRHRRATLVEGEMMEGLRGRGLVLGDKTGVNVSGGHHHIAEGMKASVI